MLSRVFRGKFIAGLKQLLLHDKLQFHGSLQELAKPECFRQFLRRLYMKEWVMYAKPPFGGAEHVLHYLARYTHRVAISNHRLVAFKEDRVSFRWKDYACGGKQKVMTPSPDEFLRRFLIHVLPKGLVPIRHFGLFANRRRAASLLRCRALLGTMASPQPPAHSSQLRCPLCSADMFIVERMTSSQLLVRRLGHRPRGLMPSTVPDHNMNIFPLIDVHASVLHRRNASVCSFQPTGLRLHNLLPLANVVSHQPQRHSQPLEPRTNYAKPLRNRFVPIQIP